MTLGWSARKLSREAGMKSHSHYSVLASRENWNADLATVTKFVEALVRAGVPREEFGAPAGRPRPPLDTFAMAREGADLLHREKGVPLDLAWLAMRDVVLNEPSPEGFYREGWRRALERAFPGSTEAAYDEGSLVDEPPGPKPPARRKKK